MLGNKTETKNYFFILYQQSQEDKILFNHEKRKDKIKSIKQRIDFTQDLPYPNTLAVKCCT